MGDLTPKILELVAKLSGREERVSTPSSPTLGNADAQGAYREALRHWWTLAVQGPEANQEEVAQIYQDILKLIDEVGEPTATRLRRQWAREWCTETGVCPWCGEAGPYHDPERGGEPA